MGGSNVLNLPDPVAKAVMARLAGASDVDRDAFDECRQEVATLMELGAVQRFALAATELEPAPAPPGGNGPATTPTAASGARGGAVAPAAAPSPSLRSTRSVGSDLLPRLALPPTAGP